MKVLIMSLFIISFALAAYKPLPPGAGAAVKPNVLFIIDDSGSMGYSCIGQNLDTTRYSSKMCQTKKALKLLFENDSITQNIRYGLTEFTRSYCRNKRMLLVPIRDRDDMDIYNNRGARKLHKQYIVEQMKRIPTNNGTPLGKVAYYARRYFQGKAHSDGSIINNFDTSIGQSPIQDKCQKNYIVLFTDGGECCNSCRNSPWRGIVTEASKMQQHPLRGFVAQSGERMVPGNENIDLYAVGLGRGVNRRTMNTIARNGGTDHGYFAENNPSKILEIFQRIIADIGAKNITATSPTLIPGFAGPENDVVYLTNFQPRDGKQWMGHLYKYKIALTGDNVLDGTPKWDLHSKLLTQIGSRTVKTVCKGMDGTLVTDFTLSNSEAITFCMTQGATGGAGNPLIAISRQTFPWNSEVVGCNGANGNWQPHYDSNGNVDGCMPKREWIDPVCKGTEDIVDMIDDQFENYRSYCGASDFSDYATQYPIPPAGSSNSILENDSNGSVRCKSGNQTINIPGYGSVTITQRDKARAIQRYLCQHNNSFCGCFARWDGSSLHPPMNPPNGKTKICKDRNGNDDNTLCGGSNSSRRDPNKPSCYNGYCVGPAIDYNNPSVWEPQDMPNYKNGLTATLEIGGPNVGKIKLKMKNLKFNSRNNSNVGSNGSISDYLVIKEFREDGHHVSHIFTTRKQNGRDVNLMYNCYNVSDIRGLGGNITIPDSCVERAVSDGEFIFPMLTTAQQNDGNDYNTQKVKLTFHSNAQHNDLAFILQSYQLKPKDIVTTRWAFSGEENENSAGRLAYDDDAVKLTARLIDFFRGYDSFQEDTTDTCDYDSGGNRVGNCPLRRYPLGDIYHSRVKFVGTPSQFYTYAGYRAYQAANVKDVDESLLIFGSNDGLLHAVNPGDSHGEEVWAFVPPSLLSRLKDIVGSDNFDKTISQFYLDSSVKVMDVCEGSNCATSGQNWKRVLVMGFGEGQEGLMALDITDLTNPVFMWAIVNETPRIYKSPLFKDLANCNKIKRVLRWDKDGNIFAYSNVAAQMLQNEHLPHDRSDNIKKTDLVLDDDCSDGGTNCEYDYSKLAKTWSEPVIAQLGGSDDNVGKFVAVVGGGGDYPHKTVNPAEVEQGDNATCYNNDAGYGGAVYVIDILHDGKILARYDIPENDNDIPQRVHGRVSILPKPQQSGLSGIQNRIMAQIYAADMSGRIWRMTVDDSDLNTLGKVIECKDDNSNKLKCLKLYDNKSTHTNKDYFFNSVAITYDGKTSESDTNVWVYAGTGDISMDGIKDNSGKNWLIAVKDPNWELSDTPGSSVDGVGVTIDDLRLLPQNQEDANDECTKEYHQNDKGWKYKLPDNFKLVGKPVIVDGYVYFTVYEHGEDTLNSGECSGHLGTSWLYSFKLFSGCHNKAFDKKVDENGNVVDNNATNKYRAKLGKGLATAPVLRGNTMYFGISGEADPNDEAPIFGQGKRDENIIRWDRPDGEDVGNNPSMNVPFTYFNEVY